MTKTLRGRCPRCCPNGGACFRKTWNDDGQRVKECLNCHLMLPIRTIKKTGKPNATQQRRLDHIIALFGGTLEIKMIGRKVWFSLENRERNYLYGNLIYGTIGPAGAFKITMPQLLSESKILTDTISLNVWLHWSGSSTSI